MSGNIYENPQWRADKVERKETGGDIAQLIAESAIADVDKIEEKGVRKIRDVLEKDTDLKITGQLVDIFSMRLLVVGKGAEVLVDSYPDVRKGVVDEINHYLSLKPQEQVFYRSRFSKQKPK